MNSQTEKITGPDKNYETVMTGFLLFSPSIIHVTRLYCYKDLDFRDKY